MIGWPALACRSGSHETEEPSLLQARGQSGVGSFRWSFSPLVKRDGGQAPPTVERRSTCPGAANQWEDHLAWVLLGLRAVPKDESGVSAAE